MLRVVSLVAALFLTGTVVGKDQFTQIRKLFGPRGQADAEVLIKFYETEVPGYMKLVEQDLAEIANDAGEDPEDLKQMQNEIKEELAEFFGEYRELRMEEPEEARNLLEMKRIEVNVEVKAAAVRDARRKASPKAGEFEKELKGALDRLFDKRLDQIREEIGGLAEEEREGELEPEGREELKHLEKMMRLKSKHRKLILEVAFLRAVEGEELFEL